MEVLVVLVMLAVLVAMILPQLAAAKRGTRGPWCANNLKQIGLSFHIWAGDNNGKFPMEVFATDGGTMELFNDGSQFKELTFLNYLAMTNELSTPKVLRCPADIDHLAATNFGVNFDNSSISYFLGLNASSIKSRTFLSGDDNFAVGSIPIKSGLLELLTNTPIEWTSTRHKFTGNLCLADGSVETVNDSGLTNLLRQTGIPTNRLAIP